MNSTSINILFHNSITKWIGIAFFGHSDDGVLDCAFCKEFRHEPGKFRCERCPIALHSGERECLGTPYQLFGKHVAHLEEDPIDEAYHALALKELYYIISLHPNQQKMNKFYEIVDCLEETFQKLYSIIGPSFLKKGLTTLSISQNLLTPKP